MKQQIFPMIKMDEEIDWTVKKYLHDDFSVSSDLASPEQIRNALYKARNPEKQPIVQAILRGDVNIVNRFLREHPETITEAMVLLALQYLPEVAVDLVIQLFTTWPYSYFTTASYEAEIEGFGHKVLRDVNELLWKTKDVENLRILASTKTIGVFHYRLILFTESATIEIYNQIRDSIMYDISLLISVVINAPIDVFWKFEYDFENLFEIAEIQRGIIDGLVDEFDNISDERRKIIDYFVNLQYIKNLEEYFDLYQNKLNGFRYLLNLLDFGEYGKQLLKIRKYLLAENNEDASNIAMFIGPTMLAS